MTDKNPYRTLHARMSPPGAAWDEGFAAGRAAATPDPRNGCRAPHCFSEYGTPCGNCPVAEKPETWPDQSAMHGVLLDQIKDAYAEGIADTLDRIRVRAAEMLPEVARFTLDEIEALAAADREKPETDT